MSSSGQHTDFDPPKKKGYIAAHFETDGGLQTVMDARRRWATEKNERMGIILEVTHTDDRGVNARDE